jgi:CubicO group peptidase (beta-lactamase class C family)
MVTRREALGALALVGSAAGFADPAVAARRLFPSRLARRAPESQGIRSDAIEAFLDALDAQGIELHSLMILRHGAVVAEGWWAPHRSAAPHSAYSASKMFTSTAIGLAVADGRLTTSTKVIDLFPDRLPKLIGERLARMRVAHLLTLSTGHDADSSARVTETDDWVRAFLADPLAYEPGSRFVYENTASYMLSAIIQKLYGTTLRDFLDDRLFAPLGIPTPHWETCPLGVNTGGWGLNLPSDALARFGQLYLDKGRWNGRQLITAAWVAKASTMHIQQRPALPAKVDGVILNDPDTALAALKASSDWYQGYGYQIWRTRHGGYMANGAFGQYIIVLPEQRTVIVTTGGVLDQSPILALVWRHLLPNMGNAALAPARSAQRRLDRRLGSLALPCPAGQAINPAAAALAGRRFLLTNNSLGAHAVSFVWRQDVCHVSLERDAGRVTLPLGFGRWISSRVQARGLVPWMALFGKTAHPADIAIAGAFAWTDDRTLVLRLQYTETPHHHLVTVRVQGSGLAFEASDVFGPASLFSGKEDT